MSVPSPITRTGLSKDTADKVNTFYHSDDISRTLPGMHDTVTVRINDVKEKCRKKLLLLTLKEAYLQFKQKFPDNKIGFSKFAELRPKECILPNGKGTHNVCVCTIHQNFKLALENSGILKDNPLELADPSYISYVTILLCDEKTPDCWLMECEKCSDSEVLLHMFEEKLERYFEEKGQDNVTIHQWVNTDRSNLDIKTLPVEEFIELLFDLLFRLRDYHFIAKDQTKYFINCKENVQPGEAVISGDFSENYNFIIQNSSQGYHWNNHGCTVHPWQVYYRLEGDTEVSHKSFAMISDELGMYYLNLKGPKLVIKRHAFLHDLVL